jgi:uncharacterized protein (TIGR00661 family)
MKVLFGTNSNGHGHQIQSIAIKQYLESRNHTVSHNLLGKSTKGISKFISDEFNIIEFDGFDFIFDKESKLIIWKTFLHNLLKFPKIAVSFYNICRLIKKENPDAIFTFYEPLVGLTALFFPNIKYISFGHQYSMTEDMYPKIKGFRIQKLFLRIINYITSMRAKKMALSYYEFKSNNKSVIPCPPILRRESYSISTKMEDFILVYLMNEDMLPQLIEEANKYPNIKIECFTKLTKQINHPDNIILRNVDGKLFQERMKVCKAVICSGGFETTCESILNKKPILMVPIKNHFEQLSNCIDANVHHMANYNDRIDIKLIPDNQVNCDEWFNKSESILDTNILFK